MSRASPTLRSNHKFASGRRGWLATGAAKRSAIISCSEKTGQRALRQPSQQVQPVRKSLRDELKGPVVGVGTELNAANRVNVCCETFAITGCRKKPAPLKVQARQLRPHIAEMNLDLSDDEAALAQHLKRAIGSDRYPLSPRLAPLKAILAKLRPEPVREPPPPPKVYAPPRARAARRRRAGG
jgi:hypothetical protein